MRTPANAQHRFLQRETSKGTIYHSSSNSNHLRTTVRQRRMGARKIKQYFSLVLSTNRQYLPVQHCSYCCELKRSEDDLGYCMCSLRCCTSMDLCELRAAHEHERQPAVHITTCGLSSARVSNAETPGLMCSRIMETWENNVNKAEVPGDQFSSSCFLS